MPQTQVKSSIDLIRKSNLTMNKGQWRLSADIVSDSEEERMANVTGPHVDKRLNQTRGKLDSQSSGSQPKSPPSAQPMGLNTSLTQDEVIVVSSDSEEESVAVPHIRGSNLEDPFIDNPFSSSQQDVRSFHPPSLPLKNLAQGFLPRTCQSNHPVEEVIYISDSDTELHGRDISRPSGSGKHIPKTYSGECLYMGDHFCQNQDLDYGIITFDPHVRARPLTLTPSSNQKKLHANPQTSTIDTASPRKSPKKRKITKEQQHLEDYAVALFKQLNKDVFDDRMPASTELIWNVRLSSTAGRAFYHRKNQQTTTKIELSPKVVDSDERVRNTLAHEMCHLAVWTVDGNPYDQGHGSQFKAWAERIMKARPDIDINTRHSYEINYKYQWECVQCHKIYGRHSKSIDVKKHACAVCDPPGQLKALFTTPVKRATKPKSSSKLASDSPRESPIRMTYGSTYKKPTTPLSSQTKDNVQSVVEVEDLICSINAMSLESTV